jgi:peptide/nickel transport system permease protein
MPKYIIGRCLQAIVVLAGVTTAVFLILNLTGDPAALLLPESATQQDYVEIRKQLGLDRPLLVQYARYMERAVAFDFGFSYRQQQPAISLVMDRMPLF